MAESFNFELVSPERLLVSEKVTEVVIPATEGEMTVMANHAPTMTTIKPGVVAVKTAAGKTERYAVFGGFADILPSGCTLLAESAVHVDELDPTVLENRIEAARAELEGAGDEKKTRLEQFIAELTKLGEIVIPA
ncbi:F0F1 ATP synthase subunit epsilon [Sinorhizobium meliloti WSM1022]|uniref:ATP synthase epsilon chain n=5 Tax=Sinorhizobium TaxID=28105 RepID=ATPE_RHIME|nr:MULTISPECIES: F0F1 ATP synthase subunit epsilon [Sinorhizobium]Q92LK9.2 RecName: Full=ATP synthase epsilon chain; AltName: Full=ATP synthase F1 sector epsilon subunit; AltName: Full=F-ATPase epsilon subunit [Sinorhizobium meliloti 1021]PST21523.1 ATP synthase epsilon chain [Mesorhizobium loti]TWA96882.1 ATP synthase F1 subcomplex epsilon subunit [Ensifer sp. SEMIA 134]TWB32856.1 ATP synthase F1 subcomplex epsilon subunit [Ensifer sp. SEMIA 135]AEG05757.1 ATP synthase epsilon chain [Sinorhiz